MSKTNALKVKGFGRNYKSWAEAVAQVQSKQPMEKEMLNKTMKMKKVSKRQQKQNKTQQIRIY